LAPVLDGLAPAAPLPSDLRVPPGGLLLCEQEQPSPLDFRKRGGGTGVEGWQLPLLLRRAWAGRRGQRSWPKDSPPDQAQVSRIVIGQDLAHVKPATYVLRTVLRHVQPKSFALTEEGRTALPALLKWVMGEPHREG